MRQSRLLYHPKVMKEGKGEDGTTAVFMSASS